MQHINCAVSSPLYQTNYCCQSESCWVYKAFALRITTSLGLSSPLLQFSARMAADSTMRSEVEELQKRANQVTDEVMPPTITKVAKFNIDLRGSSADGVFFYPVLMRLLINRPTVMTSNIFHSQLFPWYIASRMMTLNTLHAPAVLLWFPLWWSQINRKWSHYSMPDFPLGVV